MCIQGFLTYNCFIIREEQLDLSTELQRDQSGKTHNTALSSNRNRSPPWRKSRAAVPSNTRAQAFLPVATAAAVVPDGRASAGRARADPARVARWLVPEEPWFGGVVRLRTCEESGGKTRAYDHDGEVV